VGIGDRRFEMKTFYSPDGNPEIWDEKPDGYYTPEEFEALPEPRPQPKPPAPQPTPTPEQQRAARIVKIMVRLNALSAEMLPKDYTVINALCGDAEARAIVEAKREAHEAAAEPLRAELRALEAEGEDEAGPEKPGAE
jgi:hypothetical protein